MAVVAIITPININIIESLNLKSNRYAINTPIPAPVNGKGNATKNINARPLYL